VTEAVAWCTPGWGNVGYRYKSRDTNDNITFGTEYNSSWSSGGNQMSRAGGCNSFYIEGPREELDGPAEFYYDRTAHELLFYPNTTTDPTAASSLPNTVTAVTMEQIVHVLGTQAQPVKDVTITGIIFRGAAKTFFSPHESTNAGADWAIERRGAVAVEGAVNVTVQDCGFDTLGGNAVLWSNFVRNSTVTNCSFEWLGGNGVLAMGTDKNGDCTDGEHPYNNTIDSCYFRELGIYGKHSGAYAEFVAAAVTIKDSIAFNGPRAALALNDGMGGGINIHHNLLFQMVRQTSDHGPINTWVGAQWSSERVGNE
jgi:hypothetical protein